MSISSAARCHTSRRRPIVTASATIARNPSAAASGGANGTVHRYTPYSSIAAAVTANAPCQPSTVAAPSARSTGPARSPIVDRACCAATIRSRRTSSASLNDASTEWTSRSLAVPTTAVVTASTQNGAASA